MTYQDIHDIYYVKYVTSSIDMSYAATSALIQQITLCKP